MGRTVERIETPAGDPAWHVTGYAEVKALLVDQRVGRGHPDPARAARYSADQLAGRPAGVSASEYAEHALWRRAMNSVFSPAGLEQMLPTIRRVAAEVAAALVSADAGPDAGPVDLNEHYSMPLTSQVMCALLGVPADDIERFREWSEEGAQATDVQRSMSGMRLLMAYAADLVTRRRATADDDIVSVLVAAAREGEKVRTGRVVKLVAGMLAFGRETPAAVIDWGTMLLLTHPEELRVVLDEPALMPGAVEEVLRLFVPHAATDDGLLRYAHTGFDVGPVRIEAGDMVLLDVMRANRDPAVFSDPDRFDVRRSPNAHLTFGSGFYMCNFTKLGRAEIGIGMATLFERVPGIRLATAPERLAQKENLRVGGLAKLPVAW